MRRRELVALHDRIIELKSSDTTVNSIIAEYLGWTSIQYDTFAASFRGLNPQTSERTLIPDYTGSVDAALLTIPEKWVESYQHRFDDTFLIQCQPRGDLGLSPLDPVETDHLATGLSAIGILARAMVLSE